VRLRTRFFATAGGTIDHDLLIESISSTASVR